jgi:CRISPR system Cascade subunit CasA
MSEFNLLDEKWIKVQSDNGSQEVGLLEFFENAHIYKSLDGELPTQNFAVLRFLLAIMYAAFYKNIESFDNAVDLWVEIYNRGQFDFPVILDYLESYRNRFYLFDEKYPFYQIPESEAKLCGVGRLVGDLNESDNKLSVFGTYSGIGKEYVSYNEAARWLLHLMIYDIGSYGRDSKLYGYNGLTWAGKLGGVFIDSNNLFNSLMKNFVTADLQRIEAWKHGKPTWEKPLKQEIGEKLSIPPESPVELLSGQERKIKLEHKDGIVTGVRVYGGDWFDSENYFNVEQMTLWAEIKKKETKNVYPKKHDFSKMIWNGLESIIAPSDSNTMVGVLKWNRFLIEKKIISNYQIRINAIGAKYKSAMNSAIDDFYYDSLSFDVNILMANDEESILYAKRISEEVSIIIEKLTDAYSDLAFDIYTCNGGDKLIKSEIKNKAKSAAYFLLDTPFRNWISQIKVSDNIEEKSLIWWNEAQGIIKKAGKKLSEKHSLILCKERGERGISLPQAINNFEYKISSKEALLSSGKR